MICPKCGEEASEWEITSRRGSHAQGFCMAEIVASYSQPSVTSNGNAAKRTVKEQIGAVNFGAFTAYPDQDCDRGKNRCAGCSSGCPECEPYLNSGKVGDACSEYLTRWDNDQDGEQCAGRASLGPCQCGLFKGHKRICVCGTCGHTKEELRTPSREHRE